MNTDYGKLIIEWYDRSKLSIFDQFIYLWMSFNAWLSRETSLKRDSEKIDWFKNQTDYKQIFEDAISDNSELKKTAESFAKQGVRNMKSGDDYSADGPLDFEKLVEMIYQVRNNLFHGSKRRDWKVDQKITENAVILLDAVYSQIIERLRAESR